MTGIAADPTEALARPRIDIRERAGEWLARWGVLATFVVMVVVFSVLHPEVFPTWSNATSIFQQTAVIIIIAAGLTVTLAAGEFDLSFPQVFVLVTGVVIIALTKWHVGVPVAVALGLVTGLLTGVINGIVVATKRASSFIATLALGSVYTGVMFSIAGEAPIVQGVPSSYLKIGEAGIGRLTSVMFAAVIVAIIVGVGLRTSLFGRYVMATGSNAEAARVAGVRVSLVRVMAFVVMGACVAIGAVFQSSISGAHYPLAGQGLFLPPFVAAFIGTSVLAAGRFNVFGTVVGALFISVLQTGLLISNMPNWVINVVQGAVLLVAVLLASETRRRA
jgi:ribose transport system permease protein